MGKLLGMDNSFDSYNNIKLLIECNIKNMKLKPIKIITNRSIYRIHSQRYEGGITEIIKLDDDRKDLFKILHVTTKLEDFLPMIRIRQ